MRACCLLLACFACVGCSPHTSVEEISPASVKVPSHIPGPFLAYEKGGGPAKRKDGTPLVVDGKELYANCYAKGWNRARQGYLNGRVDLSQSVFVDPASNRLIQTWGYGVAGWNDGLDECFAAMKAARTPWQQWSRFVYITTGLVLASIVWFVRRGRRLARQKPPAAQTGATPAGAGAST